MTNSLSFKRLKPSSKIAILALLIGTILLSYFYWLPYVAERHYRDGYFFFMQKRYKFAAEELSLAVKYAPWEDHYLAQYGRILEATIDQASSKETQLQVLNQLLMLYQKLITMDRINPWYRNRLALSLQRFAATANIPDEQKTKILEIANLHLKTAALNDKNNPLFQIQYGFFLSQFPNEYPEAIHYLKRAIQIDDRLVEPKIKLGEIYIAQGNFDDALGYLLDAKKTDPNIEGLDENISMIYILKKDYKNAIPHLKDGLEKNPNSPTLIKNLAGAYYKTGYWSGAAATFEKLIQIDPSIPNYQMYVESVVNTGDLIKAREILSNYVKKNPNNTIFKTQLNNLNSFIKK